MKAVHAWLLASLLLLLLPSAAVADAVVITRAMTASTIMELWVDRDAVLVELELSPSDAAQLPQLMAAITQASSFPVPLPSTAELSFRADGQRLRGSLLLAETRKRVARDEVTGESLPTPSDEEVRFLRLRYPLSGLTPKTLVLEPPRTKDGYAAVNIGFVAYHDDIAVNDFRYLADAEPLLLDWNDPFYSHFERRTLRRQFDAPMNVFLYVEPFEVRKEYVVRPLDLARFMGMDMEPHEPIPAESRDALLAKLGEFLATRAPVSIDGEQPAPILDRIHFLKRGLRMTRVVTPEEPVDTSNAIVGAIFVYPVDGMPQEVRMSWDMFDGRVQRVPSAATDEAGPMSYFLTPDDSELHWVNHLKRGTLPTELEVRAPQARRALSALLVLAILFAFGLAVFAFRRRSWRLGLVALALPIIGWCAPSPTVELTLPASLSPPSGQEASPTIHALLYNVYRALDFRDEEVVFDRLSQSLSGAVLERVYLEMRKGLRLENQGGAKVRITEVEMLEVVPEETEEPGRLRYRSKWNASGSVGHWGHTHVRTNQYDARITLEPVDDRWKIADIEILEERRLPLGPS